MPLTRKELDAVVTWLSGDRKAERMARIALRRTLMAGEPLPSRELCLMLVWRARPRRGRPKKQSPKMAIMVQHRLDARDSKTEARKYAAKEFQVSTKTATRAHKKLPAARRDSAKIAARLRAIWTAKRRGKKTIHGQK